MSKNYYAVREGLTPGIYDNWPEAEKQVKGVPGAIYQGFKTFAEAEAYLNQDVPERTPSATLDADELNAIIDEQVAALKADEIIAFVDGSYNPKTKRSGYGVVILGPGGRRDVLRSAFTSSYSEDFTKTRNVAPELKAVMDTINWAIQYEMSHVTIYYDYEGIEKWATGEWKAKNPITIAYREFMKEKAPKLDVSFEHVPAHSGVTYNEEADRIARDAQQMKGHRTYKDGSVYFNGIARDDWLEIIETVRVELAELTDGGLESDNLRDNQDIVTHESELPSGSRVNTLTVMKGNSRVVINCYPQNSYIQGKPTALMHLLVSHAVDRLNNASEAIEVLQSWHGTDLSENAIRTRLGSLVPHYRPSSNKKHEQNLMASVYGMMFVGYMPEYTGLVAPIFRTYEYLLHEILGNKLGLQTETQKGRNNFAFFSRTQSGAYECNNSAVNALSQEQADLLNDLYNVYNRVRHRYSHWSADVDDVAITSRVEDAHALLEQGLKLVDRYYVLF